MREEWSPPKKPTPKDTFDRVKVFSDFVAMFTRIFFLVLVGSYAAFKITDKDLEKAYIVPVIIMIILAVVMSIGIFEVIFVYTGAFINTWFNPERKYVSNSLAFIVVTLSIIFLYSSITIVIYYGLEQAMVKYPPDGSHELKMPPPPIFN